jgi:hypothetical protein
MPPVERRWAANSVPMTVDASTSAGSCGFRRCQETSMLDELCSADCPQRLRRYDLAVVDCSVRTSYAG